MKLLTKVLFATGIMLMIAMSAMPVLAHGVILTYKHDPETGEITVTAAFDTGEVMDDAQVAIFAPNNLSEPWQTGTTDENGQYTFLPDYDIDGTWDVQVRKAGHGGIVNIPIDDTMRPLGEEATFDMTNATTVEGVSQILIEGDAQLRVTGDVVISAQGSVANNESSSSSITEGLSTTQVAIMSASVIWGFVGTALYFSQRRKGNK